MTLKMKFAKKELSLAEPTPLYEDAEGDFAVYWLGILEETAFRCNTYLIRYKEGAILVDPGNRAFFERVKERVAQIIPPDSVTGMILCHQDPDVAASMVDWLSVNKKIVVYTTPRTKILLHHYGLEEFPYRDVVENPLLEISPGHALHFVEAPFLHFPGAFATYDETSCFLFSGDIWAALDMEWKLVVEDFASHTSNLDLFHLDYMASNIAAHGFVEKIRSLSVSAILPQHGSIISEEDVPAAIEYLDGLHCGTDIIYGTGTDSKSQHELFALKEENGTLKKQLYRYKEALKQDQSIRHKYDTAMEEIKSKNKLLLLQSRMAAMGEMAGTLAHEWRQPITVIAMGINNLLLDIELKKQEDPKKMVTQLKGTLAKLKGLSETITDFQKFFYSGGAPKEHIHIKDVMERVCAIFQKQFEAKGINVQKQIESEAEVMVSPDEFVQVCSAILTNAAEIFAARGIKNPRISVSLFDKGKNVVVEYCDNGGGVKPEHMERIFEPYFSTKSLQNRVGLGLYLAKIAVEKEMGGLLEVENRGEGACFRVIIPRAE